MPRQRKPKPKPDFMGVYKKRYDPEVEGFGNASQWRDAFGERMGAAKAAEVVGDRSPHIILEITITATWDEIVKAYRRLAKFWHPDRNFEEGASKRFQEIQAAFELLESRQ